MNTLDKIAKDHYVATEAQIETLARENYTSASQVLASNATYLRVLVAGCQAALGGKKGRAPVRAEPQLEVLEKTHERFYAAVLRGVTTDDIAQDDTQDRTERGRRQLERNRRSGFARSAATTLRNYVRGGGDLRALELETVTKSELQRFVASQSSPADKVAARAQRAEKSLVNAIKLMAKGDPDKATAELEAIVERLQLALTQLGQGPPLVARTPGEAVTAREHARTRVGVPIMRIPRGTP